MTAQKIERLSDEQVVDLWTSSLPSLVTHGFHSKPGECRTCDLANALGELAFRRKGLEGSSVSEEVTR